MKTNRQRAARFGAANNGARCTCRIGGNGMRRRRLRAASVCMGAPCWRPPFSSALLQTPGHGAANGSRRSPSLDSTPRPTTISVSPRGAPSASATRPPTPWRPRSPTWSGGRPAAPVVRAGSPHCGRRGKGKPAPAFVPICLPVAAMPRTRQTRIGPPGAAGNGSRERDCSARSANTSTGVETCVVSAPTAPGGVAPYIQLGLTVSWGGAKSSVRPPPAETPPPVPAPPPTPTEVAKD